MSSSNGSGELNFTDLAPIEVPVTLGNEQYVLREAKGRVASHYKNAVSKNLLIRDGKVSGWTNMADTDTLLVSLCLFKVGAEPDKVMPVNFDFVNELPYKVVNALFIKAREISKLETADTATALRKRIADDTRKLQELQDNGEAADDPKISLAGTKDGSD